MANLESRVIHTSGNKTPWRVWSSPVEMTENISRVKALLESGIKEIHIVRQDGVRVEWRFVEEVLTVEERLAEAEKQIHLLKKQLEMRRVYK